MQILLRASLPGSTGDPELDACGGKFFPAPGRIFDRLLAVCQQREWRVSFLRDLRWSPREMEDAPAFLVVGGHTLAQPQRLYARQQEQACLRPTGSRWGGIRGYGRIFLTTAPRANSLRFLDQWSNELVISSDIAEAWPGDFRGGRLRPALDGRGEERRDAWHVQIGDILEPVIWDCTLLETWDDGPDSQSTPRRRGTLTYRAEVFSQDWDVARTAEPFGCQGSGDVLVSRRFYDCYQARKWKGLRFWPLWGQNSPQSQEHIEAWAQVVLQLERCSSAQLWF